MAEKKPADGSGEIIVPAEVTEGKVWTYVGPAPLCTNDASQQGGRK